MNDPRTAATPCASALVLAVAAALTFSACGDGKATAEAKKMPRWENPSADVKVGESLTFRYDDGKTMEKWTVEQADPFHTNYTTTTVKWHEGQPKPDANRRVMHKSMVGFSGYMIVKSLEYDPIEVANRRWKTFRIEVDDIRDHYPLTIWVTPELPCWGEVKRRWIANDTVFTKELVDWSFGKDH